jgi:hypothetical protein
MSAIAPTVVVTTGRPLLHRLQQDQRKGVACNWQCEHVVRGERVVLGGIEHRPDVVDAVGQAVALYRGAKLAERLPSPSAPANVASRRRHALGDQRDSRPNTAARRFVADAGAE